MIMIRACFLVMTIMATDQDRAIGTRLISAYNGSSAFVENGHRVRLSCETDKQWFFCLWNSPSGDMQCAIQYEEPLKVCKENPRIQLSGGKNHCDLQIQVAPEDHGVWMCLVNDMENFDSSKQFVNLEIGLEASLEMDSAAMDSEGVITLTEGDEVSIRCLAAGGFPQPSLVWFGPTREENENSLSVFQAQRSEDSDIHTATVMQLVHYIGSLEDDNKTIGCSMVQESAGVMYYSKTLSHRLHVEKLPVLMGGGGPLTQGIGVVSGLFLLLLLLLLSCILIISLTVRQRQKKRHKRMLESASALESEMDRPLYNKGSQSFLGCGEESCGTPQWAKRGGQYNEYHNYLSEMNGVRGENGDVEQARQQIHLQQPKATSEVLLNAGHPQHHQPPILRHHQQLNSGGQQQLGQGQDPLYTAVDVHHNTKLLKDDWEEGLNSNTAYQKLCKLSTVLDPTSSCGKMKEAVAATNGHVAKAAAKVLNEEHIYEEIIQQQERNRAARVNGHPNGIYHHANVNGTAAAPVNGIGCNATPPVNGSVRHADMRRQRTDPAATLGVSSDPTNPYLSGAAAAADPAGLLQPEIVHNSRQEEGNVGDQAPRRLDNNALMSEIVHAVTSPRENTAQEKQAPDWPAQEGGGQIQTNENPALLEVVAAGIEGDDSPTDDNTGSLAGSLIGKDPENRGSGETIRSNYRPPSTSLLHRSLSTSDLSISYSVEDLTKSCRLLTSQFKEYAEEMARSSDPSLAQGSVPSRTLVNPVMSLGSLIKSGKKKSKRKRRKTGPAAYPSTGSVFDCEEGCFQKEDKGKSQQLVTISTGPVIL